MVVALLVASISNISGSLFLVGASLPAHLLRCEGNLIALVSCPYFYW